MSYSTQLKDATKSAQSAYLQFLTGRLREGYNAYAFVEDDDDVAFYQYALMNIPDLCYIGCGGKSNVIELFRKMHRDEYASGNLFMVDRDSEAEPFEFPDGILRTAGYSWENHLCEKGHVRAFVQRKFNPSPSAPDADKVADFWQASVVKFQELLFKQYGLMWASSQQGLKSGASDVILPLHATLEFGVLVPADQVQVRLGEIQQMLLDQGMDQALIDAGEARAALVGAILSGRGKSLFHVLRKFVDLTLVEAGCTCRVSHENSVAVLHNIPWDSPTFGYVRQYAEGRMAA